MAEPGVRETLEDLIRRSGEGYAAISRMLGRNPAYIQQFIKRGVPRRLSEEDRRRIAAHFGVPEALLGAPIPSPASERAGPVSIPFLSTEPVAHPCPPLQVDSRIVNRIAPTSEAVLVAHVIRGDAMAPTLADGDCVLIDTADRLCPRDGLHMIASDGGPVVKRLSIHPVTRRVAILSDNAAYPSYPDLPPDSIRILGRVVWVGRRLP
ncbi:MAG: helix-turn-helix transcriptional regulator [Sphingomonadaceae bacterium]